MLGLKLIQMSPQLNWGDTGQICLWFNLWLVFMLVPDSTGQKYTFAEAGIATTGKLMNDALVDNVMIASKQRCNVV